MLLTLFAQIPNFAWTPRPRKMYTPKFNTNGFVCGEHGDETNLHRDEPGLPPHSYFLRPPVPDVFIFCSRIAPVGYFNRTRIKSSLAMQGLLRKRCKPGNHPPTQSAQNKSNEKAGLCRKRCKPGRHKLSASI